MGWLSLLWKYKAWVLLGLIVVSTASYILFLRVNLSFKEREIKQQAEQLVIVQRQNQILQQNAVAIQKQDKVLKQIQVSVAPLQKMVSQIPTESKEKLNDESITKFNDCVVSFFNNNGLLPEGCDAVKASLPVTK